MAHLSPNSGNNAAESMERPMSIDAHDASMFDDSLPTPAQRSLSDSSQTSVKKLYVSEGQRIDVNQSNVDELFENLTENNASLISLQDLFNRHPRAEFIARVINNASANETKLEELREMIFSEVRKLNEYPYPSNAELKRRVRRTGGDSVYKKYAVDIYQLVNVLDGGSFDEMSNMISFPKTPLRTEFNNSLCGTQTNTANSDILNTTVAQIQADLIQVKQENASVSSKLREEISSLKGTVTRMQHETNVLFETLKSLIAENTLGIDRINCERSSGIAKLRSDIKIIQSEVSSNRENLDQFIGESRESVSNQSKSFDKRFSKLEQRIKSINDEHVIHRDRGKPSSVSVGTQVCESELSVVVPKCCDHICKASPYTDEQINPPICNNNMTSFVDLTVQPAQTAQTAPQITRASYADRLMNRDPASHQVGAKSLSPGGQHYSPTCEQNNNKTVQRCGNNMSASQSQPIIKHTVNGSHGSQLPNDKNISVSKHQTHNKTLIGTSQSLFQREKQTPVRSDQQYKGRDTMSSIHVDPTNSPIPTRITRTDDSQSKIDSSGQDDIDDFILHVRKKTKRFYVGTFTTGITEKGIRAFIKDKAGPKVDKINFFNVRNGSDVFLRISVEPENSDVFYDPSFWPDGVRCRPWYSKNAYARNARQSRIGAEDWTQNSYEY